MSEYTPSVDNVRDRYAGARAGIGEWTRFDDSVRRAVEDAYAEFDSMIARVRAEALREAAAGLPEAAGTNCGALCHVADQISLRARANRIEQGKSA